MIGCFIRSWYYAPLKMGGGDANMVAGKEVSPEDVKNTERLRQYWEHGEG